MKTIIASRGATKEMVEEALKRVGWPISEIVSSDVDHSALLAANSLGISHVLFETEAGLYEPQMARQIRNAKMAKYSDGLIAIWNGNNGDVGKLIGEAKELGLQVVVFLRDELLGNKESNPIKNNPIFGEQAARQAETGKKENLSTKTIDLNGKRLVIYEDRNKNQPMLNIISELVDEVKKLKRQVTV